MLFAVQTVPLYPQQVYYQPGWPLIFYFLFFFFLCMLRLARHNLSMVVAHAFSCGMMGADMVYSLLEVLRQRFTEDDVQTMVSVLCKCVWVCVWVHTSGAYSGVQSTGDAAPTIHRGWCPNNGECADCTEVGADCVQPA